MVRWLMTSRDPKRSRLWPQNLWSSISLQPCEIHGRFILTSNRKLHIASPMVTWPMTSRDPERSSSWPPYLWSLISQKPYEIDDIDGQFKLTTYRKPHIVSPMVMCQMTWPQEVMVMMPISLKLNISKTVREWWLVGTDYQ